MLDDYHARIQKVLSEGVHEGTKDPNTTFRGPSKRHLNSVSLAAEDGPTLNAGLVVCDFKGIRTSIAKEPYNFVIFPSGSAHDLHLIQTYLVKNRIAHISLQTHVSIFQLSDLMDANIYILNY